MNHACIVVVLAGCGSTSTPAQKAYIGLFGDNAVAVVDTSNAKVVTTIPVTAPDGLVITPDGAKVYASSNSAGAVDVIDTRTDVVATSIAVGAQAAGLSITHDGRYVVVSVQGDGQAAIIDTATDTVIEHTDVGKAHNSAVNADGSLAFVASQVTTTPAVDVVAIPSGTAGAVYALDASPRALCSLGANLYVTVVGSASIEVVDTVTGQPASTIETGGSPHDIRPTIDGSQVLVVSQTAGDLEIVDPVAATVSTHIPTGTMPHWIALSSDGKLAYVTNEGDNDLVVVDLVARTVTSTIAVGAAPRKIAVQP